MAVQKQDGLHTDSGRSGVDLRGKENRFAAHDNNGDLVVAGAGARIQGVISEGKPLGKHSSINTKGNPILRVLAGAAIAKDQRVNSDAEGRAVPGLNNSYGYARKAVSGANVMAEIVPELFDADGA